MLVSAAHQLASGGELPVNVRFALDSEEEVGGQSIIDWVAADERGADAAIVFDGSMEEPGIPTFNTALRGLCYFHVTVRTGERDLHSGLYGGVALNATHALMQALSAVVAKDGRVPEPLRVGVLPPTPEELEGWKSLPAGEGRFAEVGARPSDVAAMREYYVRTWAEPSVDVHGLAGGSPDLVKTVLPVEARANVSIRIAPGQNVADVSAAFERLLLEAAPEGADVDVEAPLGGGAGARIARCARPRARSGSLRADLRSALAASCASAGRYPWSRASRPAGSRRSRPASPPTTPMRTRRTRSFPRST